MIKKSDGTYIVTRMEELFGWSVETPPVQEGFSMMVTLTVKNKTSGEVRKIRCNPLFVPVDSIEHMNPDDR